MIKNKDGKLLLGKGSFKDVSFDDLMGELALYQENITMFGKQIKVPRLIEYQGELGYTYSLTYHKAKPYSSIAQQILDEVRQLTGVYFNSILFNYYKNGADYMGYHKDNEKEIDQSMVASVSFGATRKFNCKHEDGELFSVMLAHGDLLLMDNFQNYWKHALPKSKCVNTARLNLTFRKIRV